MTAIDFDETLAGPALGPTGLAASLPGALELAGRVGGDPARSY